jgi:hypothetical protein
MSVDDGRQIAVYTIEGLPYWMGTCGGMDTMGIGNTIGACR